MKSEIHRLPAPSPAVETDDVLGSFPAVPRVGATPQLLPGALQGVGSPRRVHGAGCPEGVASWGFWIGGKGEWGEDCGGSQCPSRTQSPRVAS